MKFPGVGEKLIQTVWVGSLWSVGYIAAPALFAHLDSATAGLIAGELFTIVAWLSVICGALLMLAQRGASRSSRSARLRNRLITLMVTLVGASQWIVRPVMEATRLPDGTPGDGFGMWHGVSALLYLIASLLAIILVGAQSSSAD